MSVNTYLHEHLDNGKGKYWIKWNQRSLRNLNTKKKDKKYNFKEKSCHCPTVNTDGLNDSFVNRLILEYKVALLV